MLLPNRFCIATNNKKTVSGQNVAFVEEEKKFDKFDISGDARYDEAASEEV